jgi:cardiolipin synthase A/B
MFKRFFAVLMILSLLLSGCSLDFKRLLVKEKETPVSNLPAEALYFDGETTYNKIVDLISSAKKSIYIEQTIFSDERLIHLIIQKATAGVEVRILLDQFETSNQATLNQLKSKNISVQYYPARKGQTNAVKCLIVDTNRALIFSFPWTSEGFRAKNMAVLLSGKSVWKLAGVFNRDWQFTTTLSLGIPETTNLPDDYIVLATNTNVKQQVIEHISGSEQSVWAIVSQVTDQDTIQAFIDAANKGRDVRLILDPKIMPNNWPGTIEKLKTSGAQIRYFKASPSRPMELNVGIFDGDTFLLSSSGWGYKSFVMNHELSITAPAPAATLQLVKQFDQEWQSSSSTP